MIFGSGECDQLGLGEDIFERKKAAPLTFFEENNLNIVDVQCGSMHTLALTNDGRVYSWGNNDEGALGRPVNEGTPIEAIEIPSKIDGISAGDSHSLAYNKSEGIVYIWGLY